MQETTVTTSDILGAMDATDAVIVDTRPVDAYNGWKLKSEARGGHIKGAKSFPSEWTTSKDWLDLAKSKGIVPESHVIVYGYAKKDASRLASHLIEAGYERVSTYDDFVAGWTADQSLPMEHLPRFRHLVPAQWLFDLIQGKQVAQWERSKYVVCHAHYRHRSDYDEGHIPGAIALDTLELETPKTWNRRSPQELKAALQNKGITADTTVIIYGRFSSPNNDDPFPGSNAGHLGAMRCATIMMYAGVKDVRVLNGGIHSWQRAGFRITRQPTEPKPVADFGVEIPAKPEVFVDLPEAKTLLAVSDGELVSVRSWNEFIGDVSGYNYIDRKGRIPGAVFGNCGSDAYHMESYRNQDHTTREYHEIGNFWRESEIVPKKHIAFYCGTGWRASEAFFNSWLMDWPKTCVFDGGWLEWSNDLSNPVETGIPNQHK